MDEDERRVAMCKALAIPYTSDWDAVTASARNAGIVRDAEYRWSDRVDAENKNLHAAVQRVREFCEVRADPDNYAPLDVQSVASNVLSILRPLDVES